MPEYRTIDKCRLCGSTELLTLFTLGDQFVSDFVEPGAHLGGVRCPLELVLCRGCSLVQLRHTAPQQFMYSRHYWYRSGVTATMRAALADVAACAQELVPLSLGDVILDIGSNDGTLLRAYDGGDLVRVGVEPADNLVEEGSWGVSELIHDFWSQAAYRAAMGDRQAQIVTALGMLYDLDDPMAFVRDIAAVLADDGLFVAQLMCLRQTIDSHDVGNLCHEHLESYSLDSLDYLFGQNGLEIIDIEANAVNGGSYRFYCRKAGSRLLAREGAAARLAAVRAAEDGLASPEYLRRWFEDVERNKAKTVEFIRWAVESGKTVWAYGASTKGNVLLQYYRLDSSVIAGAAERSPEKVGKVTIGTDIPIYSEEDARRVNPDYFLVLPYAFLDEFTERESVWRSGGGRFIVPLPEFRIV